MAAQTLARFRGDLFAAPVIVASQDDYVLISDLLTQTGVQPQGVILEPVRRNTAAAIAAGVYHIARQDEKAVILAAPIDHLILDEPAFYDAVDRALACVDEGYIAAFGAAPSSLETGYGYIEKGAALKEGDDAHIIKRFVEKPSMADARQYIETKRFLWNTGIFLFRADVIGEQFALHAPEYRRAIVRAFEEGRQQERFFWLGESFAHVPDQAFDRTIMEATDQGAVVAANMGWHDIGTWRSLWQACPKDQNGNVMIGAGEMLDSHNCLIRSDEGISISVLGADDLVIVAAGDRVLVAGKKHAERIKELKRD